MLGYKVNDAKDAYLQAHGGRRLGVLVVTVYLHVDGGCTRGDHDVDRSTSLSISLLRSRRRSGRTGRGRRRAVLIVLGANRSRGGVLLGPVSPVVQCLTKNTEVLVELPGKPTRLLVGLLPTRATRRVRRVCCSTCYLHIPGLINAGHSSLIDGVEVAEDDLWLTGHGDIGKVYVQ